MCEVVHTPIEKPVSNDRRRRDRRRSAPRAPCRALLAHWRGLMLMPDLRFPLLRGFIEITRARIIRDWYRGGATLCGLTGHAFAAWPEDMARIAGYENNGNQILGDELCRVATEVLQEASFL